MANSITKYTLRLSYIAIIVIVSHTLIFKDFWKSWKTNETQFVWDVNNYYSYLPATFIHKDLTFNYKQKVPFWLIEAPNGAKVQKGTCGMAIMYLPFFLLGHQIASNTHVPLDGYSGPYSDMVHYGTIFYCLLGFFFLQKVLARYFKDAIVALTLICVFFGTNLFYYTVGEGEMTHSYLFCLFAVFLWLMQKWYDTFYFRYSIGLGLIIGLITLIRPTEIIIVLVFLLYGVATIKGFKERFSLLVGKWKHILIMLLFFFLVLSPQLMYWKWLTGNFFFFSYGSAERFFWGDPMFSNVLFGYRKGWLIYTPIMIFSIAGMFFGKRYFPNLNYAFKIYLLINIYIIASWWCWWYGGSFGMRALVQSYCFLAFFMAAFFDFVFSKEWKFKLPQLGVKYLLIFVLCFFISLNLIQTFQYKRGMLSYDSMTKKAYWVTFCKFEHEGKDAENFWSALRSIDYEKAKLGERNQ